MRWSIIRLIWARELRDQSRDRRTVFMIAVLPVLLYPVAGFGVLQLAMGFIQKTSYVGVAGAEHLPRPTPAGVAVPLVWLSATPPPPGAPPLAGLASAVGAAWARRQTTLPFPALLAGDDGTAAFAARYLDPTQAAPVVVRAVEGALPERPPAEPAAFAAEVDRSALLARRVDVLLAVPPDFARRLKEGGQPEVHLLYRERDEHSKLVARRVGAVLNGWKRDLTAVRLANHGLPPSFQDAFTVHDPERDKPPSQRREEGLFTLMVRVFPFILVLWSLAGALYPAVDLCAGEKERGTMETLLISPASREEIVWGKFLTIWVFSAVTALLNLLSMGVTTYQLGSLVPGSGFRLSALLWGVALLLPLSAFFSAVCLSIGAYVRSSKEGQYYLMPLFLLTMPLIMLTLVPGVELSPFYSMVPVTGVALLLQKLMTAGPADRGLYLYFVPVLAPMVIYSWLALRWGIGQFQREEVLFREAERLDLGLWLRRLLREKEPLPTGGEAFFCFGLLVALRWLALNAGTGHSLLARTGVSHLAFVATPPLLMAVILTTNPVRGLGLRRPPGWALAAAVVLAVLAVVPLAELVLAIYRQFPALGELLKENHPLTQELLTRSGGGTPDIGVRLRYLFGLGLLPAVCEELAFRGFIFAGLRRAFRPWTAVLLSSFLFAVYHLNVFQMLPHFLLGVLLGLLAWKANSVVPSMLFHFVYNALVLTPAVLLPEAFAGLSQPGLARGLLASAGAVLGLGLVALLARRPDP